MVVTLSPVTVAMCCVMSVTTAVALSLAMGSEGLVPRRIEAVGSRPAAASRTPGVLGSEPWDGGWRAADRVIERRVRGAILADPFLAPAAPRVKVTSRHGVLRLAGRVGTAKERSSIAFKAGQVVQVGRIDDRVTIGNAIEGAGQ